MQKKCILVLTSTFPRWHADSDPSFVFELCRRLNEKYKIIILAPRSPGTQVQETIDGLTVIRYPYFISRYETLSNDGGIMAKLRQNPLRYLLIPFFLAGQFLAVRKILRNRKIDLIHAHWLFPQGWIAHWFCRKKSDPALVCTSHGTDLFGLKSYIFKILRKQVGKDATAITVVSQAMRDQLIAEGMKSEKIHVLPMGVDLTTQFTPGNNTPERDKTLLFVGRLVDKKGVTHLLKSLFLVKHVIPDCRLLIAGDGPARAQLENEARTLGLTEHVTFLGAIENRQLPEIYRRAGIFVSASLEEGFGLVYVEALGCECAVIAAELPAIKDIIINNNTGLLVEQRNPDDLAEKIILLLNKPGLRQKIALSGREYALKSFDWENSAKRYTQLFERLLN